MINKKMNILWREVIFVFFYFTGNVRGNGWFANIFDLSNDKTDNDCNETFGNKNCEKETTVHKMSLKVTEATLSQDVEETDGKFLMNKGYDSTPSLFVDPRNQTARVDQEVVIQCRDEGNTRLEVFWSRPGNKSLPQNATDHNGRLTIRNIKCEDGGYYVCRPVKNKYKKYSSISTVEVICRTALSTVANALVPYTPTSFKKVQLLPCKNSTFNGKCCHLICENCGLTCNSDQFQCSNGDCIDNEKFCDGEIDCSDASDEEDCSSSWLPKITMLPKLNVEVACLDPRTPSSSSSTLELQCAFVGHPIPTIKWKKYEGHVPSKCLQSSLNGRGILKCPDFQYNTSGIWISIKDIQQSDQGAYSCVAENSKGSAESQPKSIVKCSNFFSCDGFKVVDDHNIETCLECFCFEKTKECQGIKSELVKNKLEFPTTTDTVFIDINGKISFTSLFSVGQITYCSVPEDILASHSFLKSYGRNLNVPRYNDKSNFFPEAPDVIIGNQGLILKYSFNKISHDSLTSDIRFWTGLWHHNNGTIASRADIMNVLSNMKLLLLRCEYQTNVILDPGNATITIESSKITDSSSSVSYIEKCSCPKAYDGLSCEKCSPGYRKKIDGLGFICEEDTLVCNAGYIGKNCDQCDVMNAYYKNSKGMCVKSRCNMKGSLGLFPDDKDKCICKANVIGDYCDTCKSDSFYMDETNPDGCKKCWCNNVSDTCTSSKWYKTEISSTSLGGYNASTGRNFWLLPSEFNGNRLTSYGGFLRYSMKYLPNLEKQPNVLTVEILSGDDITLKYLELNLDNSKSGTEKTWSVPIEEPNWRDAKDKVVSRGQLLKVLSNIKAIYIESPYHLNSGAVQLSMVQLDVAEEFSNDFNLFPSNSAEKVEQCSCPEGYTGLSCESCSNGYYKKKISNSYECVKCDCLYCDPEYGCKDCKRGEYNDNPESSDLPNCIKCPCNGNEEYCYKDVYGQVMCICKINYSGISCQNKEITTPSHLNVKITPIKVKNKKAGSVITFNCSYDSTEDMQIVFKKSYKVSTDKINVPTSGLDIVHSTINKFDTVSSANITIDLNLEFVECLVYNTGRVKVGHVFAIIEGTVTDYVKPVIENCYDEPKHVKESEDLDLICEASGTPEPEIQWYLKLDNSMQKVDTVNGVHSIMSADLQRNGTIYFCIATNSVGDDKCSTHIIVQKRCDIISAKPEHARVYEGEKVRFVCSTTNNSLVSWSRINEMLPYNSNVNGGTLEIENVQLIDAGEYLCEANTTDGHISKTVKLTVNIRSVPPTAMILNEDVTLTLGEYFQIKCTSTGQPKPVIYWSKILDNLPPNTYVSGDSLTISSAMTEHTGVYECTAKSTLGNATSRISVKVIEKPEISIEPYSINKVMKGKSLNLRCVVEKGVPRPSITWSKIGNFFINVQDEYLRLQNAEIEDAGKYLCLATNEVGYAEAEAEVIVLIPPTVKLKPSGSLHAYIDEYVDITCKTEGFPEPEITWKQKTSTISQFTGETMFEIKILEERSDKINIRVTSDLHSITCKAENEAGEVSESLLIIPKARGWTAPGPKSESIRAELGTKVELIFDGISGVIECRKDNSSLPGDVCYTSNGLEISSVQVHHRGTYKCQSKSNPLQEKSLVVAVTGFVHKFSENLRSYLLLPLTVKSKEFRVEITFKADRPSGLILLKKRNHEFIMCLTRNSTLKVKLHHSHKVLILESRSNLELHVWYTVVFKAGLIGELFIYDENGEISETQSSALNFQINWYLNHSDEIYVGGISNKKRLSFPLVTSRLPSFEGCISRLIIDDHEYRMTEEGKYSKDVSLCKMCSSSTDPCAHRGVCLDAPTQYGFVCVCDEDEWSCPKSCKKQGCRMKNDLCKMINPCINPENKCVYAQDRLSCRCAPGFSGLTCEKEEKFNFRLEGNGFVKLPPSYLPRYSFFESEIIAIKFTPSDLDGLLLWQGDINNHLCLIITNGKLEYVYYNQGKNLTVNSDYDIRLNFTHYVVLTRINSTVTIKLDDKIYEGSNVFSTNRVHGDIFIGGISDDEKKELSFYFMPFYSTVGFKGCIHSVAIGDVQKSINIMEKDIARQNIRKCDFLHISQSFDIMSRDLQSESEEDSAESDDDQNDYN